MKMNFAVAACAAALLSACATTPYPDKRPMSAEGIEALGATAVVVVENNNGVEKSWFMTDSSAAGASYGLIGALTTAVMDAIINAGPSRRAQLAAEEVAGDVGPEELTASLRAAFETALDAEPESAGVTIESVGSVQRIMVEEQVSDTLEVNVSYTLSEDAAAFRVSAVAIYTNAEMTYKTPYVFEKSVPKSELTGPVYRNRFIYHSDAFPIPILTDDLKARLTESIRESYADEAGNLPVEGDGDYKKMQRELKDAADDKLSNSEASMFLVREWLKDDAAPLRAEIESAHAFLVKYIMSDMNDTSVPAIDGQDRLLEELEDGRVVRMAGTGTAAGSIISSPGNTVAFPSYGNAIQIAKVHRERISDLRDEAKSARKAGDRKAAR